MDSWLAVTSRRSIQTGFPSDSIYEDTIITAIAGTKRTAALEAKEYKGHMENAEENAEDETKIAQKQLAETNGQLAKAMDAMKAKGLALVELKDDLKGEKTSNESSS